MQRRGMCWRFVCDNVSLRTCTQIDNAYHVRCIGLLGAFRAHHHQFCTLSHDTVFHHKRQLNGHYLPNDCTMEDEPLLQYREYTGRSDCYLTSRIDPTAIIREPSRIANCAPHSKVPCASVFIVPVKTTLHFEL